MELQGLEAQIDLLERISLYWRIVIRYACICALFTGSTRFPFQFHGHQAVFLIFMSRSY